ncbi:MAG: AraC family transcriptional regulator [Bacteroidota bacterium]
MKDFNAIYKIKDELHRNISTPPVISQLAKDVSMSEPKLRKLFRQTFGHSVYDYYQVIRMQEAARLFREEKLTVSEVGYRLGFTNLSHFTREFGKQIGVKPKKYSMSLSPLKQ